MNFADRLGQTCIDKKSLVLVGIDPNITSFPKELLDLINAGKLEQALIQFGRTVIDAVKDVAVAVKPQVAYYEQYGLEGFKAFADVLQYAKKYNVLTIADIKRGDIGSTAEAYANAYLKDDSPFACDAITVNAYLGSDGVNPFVKYCSKGKGVYLLVKTSNPSSGELQDKVLSDGSSVSACMAALVRKWGESFIGSLGYSSVGAVVGATYPDESLNLRQLMPQTPFLIPGYGAQGGTANDAKAGLDEKGLGGIVNSSRGIIYAYSKEPYAKCSHWADAIKMAALDMQKDLNI